MDVAGVESRTTCTAFLESIEVFVFTVTQQ
jgi:hypothetical protein